MLEGRIGFISIRVLRTGFEALLGQAVESLGDAKGLIIDLRGNEGGEFHAKSAFRSFDLAPGDMAGPRPPCYKGPIALLIDEQTIGAGEEWASWFVARKRARVFGTTSAGALSRGEETYTLSNGLYQVVIPTKADAGFLGEPIEGRGLKPDVEVRCSAMDLSHGRDTVAEAAARWLAEADGNAPRP